MIKFFYDSLETLQKVSFPTKKDYINLTLSIFATVVIAGAFFVLVDTIASGAYRTFYTLMRPNGQEQLAQQQLLSGATAQSTGTDTAALSGITIDSVELVTGDKN